MWWNMKMFHRGLFGRPCYFISKLMERLSNVAWIFPVGFFAVWIFHHKIFFRTDFSPYGVFAVRKFRRTEFSPYEIFAVRNFCRIASNEWFMVFSSIAKINFSSVKQFRPSIVQWEIWTCYEFNNDLVFIRFSALCLCMVLRYLHVYIHILKTLEGMNGYVKMWFNLNVHDLFCLVQNPKFL